MAEVLSQSEIDQLLNNIKSGAEEKEEGVHQKEIVPFDFRLPNRISKNQLRTIVRSSRMSLTELRNLLNKTGKICFPHETLSLPGSFAGPRY